MDYDKKLVEAILREGKPGLKAALDQGIRTEVMFGEGAKCFDFILSYTKSMGEMPTDRDGLQRSEGRASGRPERRQGFVLGREDHQPASVEEPPKKG